MERYLFSRRDWPELATTDPVSLATEVFFQMWRTRAFPYNCLSEGDLVYIGDTRTRRVGWEVRLTNLLADFGYATTKHALSALRSAYGLYAADLNDYHRNRTGKGWLLAWSPNVMQMLDVELPSRIRFGQNGYRLLDDDDLAVAGLPKPKSGTPLAAPPSWYEPAAAHTGERRDVPRYIPLHVRECVAGRDNYRCVGCGATRNLHMDHIRPHSHGGASTANNLRLVCAVSNLTRGAGDPGTPLPCASRKVSTR